MIRSTTILGALLLAAAAASADVMPVVTHDVQVRFDLPNHGFEVVDVMSVPAGVDTLLLNAGVALQGLSRRHPDGALEEQRPGAAIGETVPPDTAVVRLPVNPIGRPLAAGEAMQVTLAYAARWRESTADVTFSRENVGREIQGTVSDEGIYLAASSYWLPLADKALHTYRLKVVTPAGWEPLTQGERTLHQERDGLLTTVWESDEPSDSLTLIANRYLVTERDFDGVLGATYFLADEPALVETYLERTGAYLEMYGAMIGPYPFTRFTTVENWFPTGYGMPGWTLLGGQVLRLPFIPTTSFGHEIAHNWWGNSVFVDAARGNWCEGLTVYCADYHYKELESPAAAREYRRTLLKDYAAYVRDGRDLPLRDFRERHSGATRAVGYGKSMMVFHMIDEAIGRDAFLAALREVARTHLFREASWDDFLAAFAAHGSRDLAAFGEAWLGRAGAPLLRLESATREGDRVTVALSQESGPGEPAWPLRVPVTAATPAGPVAAVVEMDGPRAVLTWKAPGATAVQVDPDYHVFRRLHPEEIEPTLSQVLGDPEPRFVLPAGPLAGAAATFAADWVEGSGPAVVDADADLEGHSRILVNPDLAVAQPLLPPAAQLAGGLLFLDGQRHDLANCDAVLAVPAQGRPGAADLLVFCRSAERLAALAGRLSHYGKYSHLVFPARGAALKGNWEAAASPLRAELPGKTKEK
ncbi:MAG: hypothetical protein IPM94_10665 [bacterium]|nr:hypothetical protein [bacterium]